MDGGPRDGGEGRGWSRSQPDQADSSSQERIAFYSELLNLERAVLSRMEELAAGGSEELRATVRRTNIEPLRELIRSFEERLRFWRLRAEEESEPPG